MEKEIWRMHPDMKKYEFSNFGNFRKSCNKKVLKNSITDEGYVKTILYNDKLMKRVSVRIHRIVAELFVQNTDIKNNIIIHKDGNLSNNYYTNLIWSTTKETVKIAIDNGNRKRSNWEKLSNEDVINIREEFDSTFITIGELAKKFKITNDHVISILKYTSRENIEREKKNQYKINYLDNKELNNFLNIKKNKYRKTIELTKNYINPTILNNVLFDYVNSGLTIIEISAKYKIPNHIILFNIKNNKLPTPIIQNGEIFKSITSDISVSNYGRLIIDGRITHQLTVTIPKIGVKQIKNIIAELFVPNPNELQFVRHIDKNKNNLNYSNLEWFDGLNDYIWDDIQYHEEIKNLYINTSIQKNQLSIKFSISSSRIKQILSGIKKNKVYLCKICNVTDKILFSKSTTKLCKKCISLENREYYNSLSEDERKLREEKALKWRMNNLIKIRVTTARIRARKKNIHFDLTTDFIKELYELQNCKCKYTGKELLDTLTEDDLSDYRINDKAFSIDRIDSNAGYTKDNVVLVRTKINLLKNDLPYLDFIDLIKTIYEYMDLKNFEKKI
jgi:hypothetical protein